MKPHILALAAALMAGSAVLAADSPPAQPGQTLLVTRQTISGQPITAPTGPLQVTATISELAPGESTSVHKHPYLRFDYVLEGRLSVKNLATGKTDIVGAGQFVVDPIDQWHQGTAIDGKRARLLVIDQVPVGQTNLVLKDPRRP